MLAPALSPAPCYRLTCFGAAAARMHVLEQVKSNLKLMAALMTVLQCVPIGIIYLQKRRASKPNGRAKRK